MPRRLGQHFLKNQRAVKKIIAALELNGGETVIEIGAGHGELTFPLAEVCQKIGCKVVAIEKDPELGSRLEVLGFRGQVEIIQGDALSFIKSNTYNLKPNTFKIVGNIPYYITGRLLRNISELKNKPKLYVFTLQKEVALRICAEPPKMNRLAAIVQFWAEPKIIGFIPKTDFEPLPKVDSAIIKLGVRLKVLGFRGEKQNLGEEDYYRIVKILFQQPRKTVANNLAAALKVPRLEIEEKLKELSLGPNLRPQDLNLEEILKISAVFQPRD